MSNTQMKRITNKKLLSTAVECLPDLKEEYVLPVSIVTLSKQDKNIKIEKTADGNESDKYLLKKGNSLCFDFGNHYVGYVTLKLKSVGSPQDAPAYIRLKFGEVAKEILENSDEYEGWISRSWIQEEFMHFDTLPVTVTLPRRYAFRYMEIMAVDTSKKWQLVVEEVTAKAVSCVSRDQVTVLNTEDNLLKEIDRVSIRTLQNCMQLVFEDGPKRDRRLWLGDLRLQALANYKTFRKNDLVKRCLYLFAAQTREDGKISACLFLEPEYIVDDTFFFDYSLFFIPILYDYYEETKDRKALEELWDSAYRQIEIAKEEFNNNHLLKYDDKFKCFIDWKEGLDKQASAQAIYIYCLRRAIKLAKILGMNEIENELKMEVENKAAAAMKYFWDENKGLFISGKAGQVSYASQVWMILAEVVSEEQARELINNLIKVMPDIDMVTPYMNHHFVEALKIAGENEKAVDYIKYYWGGMVKEGADTFWELYNPINPTESPYGSSMVNSYCHAWSCTPAYLLR